MAIIRLKNLTKYRFSVPVASVTLPPYGTTDVTITDIDEFYNDSGVQKLMLASGPKIEAQLIQDSTPGATGDAILPFYASGDIPPAAGNPGMMVYNTTNEIVLYSDGTKWLATMTIPVFTGFPLTTAFPDPYLIFERNTQSLYFNFNGEWKLTRAAGIQARPSHLFPSANSVPVGTLLFDSDNGQLKLSDGSVWQLTNQVNDYGQPVNLPLTTTMGAGALAYTSRDSTLWTKVGGSWRPTTGILRYYATFGDLPALGDPERGAAAYIDDDRTIVVWDGKYWLHMCSFPTYKTADLPDPANRVDGYAAVDGNSLTIRFVWAGSWLYPTPVANPYPAASRPNLAEVPVGTMIFNTTSGKPNWSTGAAWVDASGVVDP